MNEAGRILRILLAHAAWINPCIYEGIPCYTAPGFCRNYIFNLGRRKNRGEAKTGKGAGQRLFLCLSEAANGVPGCPRAHTLQAPHRGARYSALYRPDNRTIKSPARHVGPGFLAGGKAQPHEWTPCWGAAAVSAWRGEYVNLTMTTRQTTERKC